jgi:hypothetical protein
VILGPLRGAFFMGEGSIKDDIATAQGCAERSAEALARYGAEGRDVIVPRSVPTRQKALNLRL